MSDNSRERYWAETAGALTPDLERAAHSSAHPARTQRQTKTTFDRGERASVRKINLPNRPKRP